MHKHIMQSAEWGQIRQSQGVEVIVAGPLQFTKHAIPKTKLYYAYCPKVSLEQLKAINWTELKETLNKHHIFNINFDVPDILKDSPESKEALKIFLGQDCKKAPKNTFAEANFVLDISGSEDELLEQMNPKQRYNIRLAQKKGVVVKVGDSQDDLDVFYKLFELTGKRQKYYNRPKKFIQTVWDTFRPKGMVHIVTSYFENKPLASWMFFVYENTLYYPYGGMSEDFRNVHGTELTCWEGIRLGKSLGCTSFDMWGAAVDLEDTKDPWWGFSNFKRKFGAQHVHYMDSYDFVINPTIYNAFNFSYRWAWKVLRFLR